MLTLENAAPPVRRVPLALARRFFQICTVAAAQSLAEANLTPLEFAVMAYVNKSVGEPGIDQTALAARMGIDRNNTSLLVSQLVAKGLLEARINAEDRRARLLWLTPRGEKLHARLYPRAGADQLAILDAALEPAERELLLDLLVRVIQSNRELARPGAGRRKRGSVSGPTTT
jgi:DNA-binding MarR family transcriptional regulator